MSENKKPLKHAWEIWVLLFVVLGCLATAGYAIGETFWG